MTSRISTPLEYPETDGKPMGETDLHRDWMVRIIDLLRERYRGERVYVSGDLLVYYEEGNPKRFVVPDAFVVKDCEPGRRRIFKVWEEGKAPDFVLETTSRRTRKKDQVVKPEVFARIGVKEYFLYDPTAEYLRPPLQGFRLEGRGYAPIAPQPTGALESRELGIVLALEGGDLVLRDRRSGERLLTAREAAEAEAERLRRKLADLDEDREEV
jgi:Uma2 family endonuclease